MGNDVNTKTSRVWASLGFASAASENKPKECILIDRGAAPRLNLQVLPDEQAGLWTVRVIAEGADGELSKTDSFVARGMSAFSGCEDAYVAATSVTPDQRGHLPAEYFEKTPAPPDPKPAREPLTPLQKENGRAFYEKWVANNAGLPAWAKERFQRIVETERGPYSVGRDFVVGVEYDATERRVEVRNKTLGSSYYYPARP